MIITILLMIIVTSACIALSIKTIQKQYKAIRRETETFLELIEEHSIQVY